MAHIDPEKVEKSVKYWKDKRADAFIAARKALTKLEMVEATDPQTIAKFAIELEGNINAISHAFMMERLEAKNKC